jgi:hypothetical protein
MPEEAQSCGKIVIELSQNDSAEASAEERTFDSDVV